MTSFTSRYNIDDQVELDLKFPLEVDYCEIGAVRFTKAKVYYDVWVMFKDGGCSLMKDVDSVFVSDKVKPPHRVSDSVTH